MSNRIQTYAEFWPVYLQAHQVPACRLLHYVGTIGAVAMLGAGLLISSFWFWMIPVVGYAPAWIGHFGIEKNKPASFGYPLWSLISDFRMCGLALTGRLDAEMLRARSSIPGA